VLNGPEQQHGPRWFLIDDGPCDDPASWAKTPVQRALRNPACL